MTAPYRVWQHSWCGTLVKIPTDMGYRPATPGLCPNMDCKEPTHSWWGQGKERHGAEELEQGNAVATDGTDHP